MSEGYRSAGVKDTSPFVADPDPNVTPPSSLRILQIPDQTIHGRRSAGLKFYPEFTTPVGGPEIDLTVWSFDERNSNFVKALGVTGVTNYTGIQIEKLAPARVVFQITALNVGTADSVELFGAPTG